MLGLWGELLHQAMARVNDSVDQTLADEQGRWVLSSKHQEAFSELPLTRVHQGEISDLVIDRTFVDVVSGERWIVDYKNSAPAQGVSLDDFTREQSQRYQGQLQAYRDSMREFGGQPIRCALYFTSLALLHPVSLLESN